MHEATAGNLRSAYGGEAMAHRRYQIWGEKAQKEGLTNIARLFKAIAVAEEVHASNHFRALAKEGGDSLVASMAGFGLGSTPENLQGGIDGETYEITEMYPAFLEVARMQKEKVAEKTFFYAIEAEKVHAKMFAQAKKAADAGKDMALGPVRVCSICGYTVEGDAPAECPVCKAKQAKYLSFE